VATCAESFCGKALRLPTTHVDRLFSTPTAPTAKALFTAHPRASLSEGQIRNAVQRLLGASAATAPLHIEVDVMDHRVFLVGRVRNAVELRLVEQTVARVPDVAEVLDLLDVEQSLTHAETERC